MALNVSGYVDPGVLIGEVVTPAAIAIATTPDVLGIVAHGSRSKRSINEAVKRGQVFDEALTLAVSSPHTATLVSRGDRRIANTKVRRTLAGNEITLPDNALSYVAASLLGTAAGPFNLTVNNEIGFKMDAGQEVTIRFLSGAPGVVISGSLINVTGTLSGAGATATRAEVATLINSALAAATSLGYGAAYAAVATDATTGIKLTSPVASPASDVQILAPFTASAVITLGFTAGQAATTLLQVADAFYDGSATYEADYVAINTNADPLSFTATSVIRVGSFAGVTSFQNIIDYLLTGGDIDWTPDVSATFTSSVSATYNLSTNDTVRIALDGKAAITIDLNGLVSPPPGYANPAAPAAATAAEVANNINAIIATSLGYGPRYRAVATVSSNKIVLTSPNEGIASSIEISAPTATDATTAIFGLSTGQYSPVPFTVIGTGARPVVGATYFVTYTYARPTTEYNTPKRFFSEDQMIQDLTPVSTGNILAVYGQIAFENDAPSIVVCQVNDQTLPGFPTVNEVKAAIDGLETTAVVTDVVVADTRLNTQINLLAHISSQSAPTEKHYRSGWFGMASSALIGDKDTPDTFVYRAAVTLQVAADSPARGRMNLVYPGNVQRTITLEDGSEATLTMDSTAMACAVAGRHTSFTSPALSLANKLILGFDTDTFPTIKKAERAQLASNGVLVVTNEGGRLTILDPITTEAGGGALPPFMFRSAIAQKDNVTRAVDRVLDTNLRGVVPSDLADFIFDIKVFIGQVLTSLIQSGAIGPFRDSSGASRDIDLASDVQAEQSKTDPTKFFFRYFYFLRYPALRFFGEFSVDNPFFGT